jgi:hypothetical protein
VNVLDEIPQSYSHQGNPKLDQPKYITKKWDHESMDSEMVKLISKVCAFCEEKGHAIMDCPFVPFHIKANIVKHVELTKCGKSINGSNTSIGTKNSCSSKHN